MNFWQTLPKPIIGLAPMDSVTDASFRFITAKYGRPDIMLTEFVNIQSTPYAPELLLKDFTYAEIERPIVAQIYGKTPELFYKVAHIVGALGFDGLDINMGCPAKKVAAAGCGAALIREPELARAIIQATRQGLQDWYDGQSLAAIGIRPSAIAALAAANQRRVGIDRGGERRLLPLSIKTRIGYDRIVVQQWLSTLLEERPAAITLHGRTLQQGYKGSADWDAIGQAAEIARGSGTLLLGNGDLRDLVDVYRRVQTTQVDGVLIGRSAEGNPWLFADKQQVKLALRGSCAVNAQPPCLSPTVSTSCSNTAGITKSSCKTTLLRHAQELALVLPRFFRRGGAAFANEACLQRRRRRDGPREFYPRVAVRPARNKTSCKYFSR